MYRRDRAKPPRATSQSNRRWEEKKSEPVSGVYTVRERPFRAYKKNVPFGPLLTMLSRLDFNPPRRAVNIPASGPRESESRFLPIRFLLLFYFFCFFLTLLVLFFFLVFNNPFTLRPPPVASMNDGLLFSRSRPVLHNGLNEPFFFSVDSRARC